MDKHWLAGLPVVLPASASYAHGTFNDSAAAATKAHPATRVGLCLLGNRNRQGVRASLQLPTRRRQGGRNQSLEKKREP